jgi:hypothetical protein
MSVHRWYIGVSRARLNSAGLHIVRAAWLLAKLDSAAICNKDRINHGLVLDFLASESSLSDKMPCDYSGFDFGTDNWCW